MTNRDASAWAEAERRARAREKEQAEAMRANREDWALNHPAPETPGDDTNQVAAEAGKAFLRDTAGDWQDRSGGTDD